MSKEIKQQRMNARDEASQLFCWCIVTAMNHKKKALVRNGFGGPVMRCRHSKPATKVKSTLGTGERPLKPCGTI